LMLSFLNTSAVPLDHLQVCIW